MSEVKEPLAESEGPYSRILLAEDNAVNTKIALRLLQKLGYSADTAANGIEVLEAVSKTPYDIILMDIQMPGMDGLQATQEIRRQEVKHRHTIIIAMTAHAMAGDREKYIEAGMDDYISKPINLDILNKVLQHWTAVDKG